MPAILNLRRRLEALERQITSEPIILLIHQR